MTASYTHPKSSLVANSTHIMTDHIMTDDTAAPQAQILETREYQLEMLNESLKRNIVIALDTGAGKTHIAVLRLKLEAERELRKACCPCCRTTAALLIRPPALDLMVPRADCRACAAAAGRHRERCSCPCRAHLKHK